MILFQIKIDVYSNHFAGSGKMVDMDVQDAKENEYAQLEPRPTW